MCIRDRIDPTAQTPLKDTGLETTRLKGTKWNGNIDITYTSATGKITYSASSDYYTCLLYTSRCV